jgi:hypothetical protein
LAIGLLGPAVHALAERRFPSRWAEAILPRKYRIPEAIQWLDFAATMYWHLPSRCQASSPALPETNPKNQWAPTLLPELIGKLANFLTFPILSSHIRLVHFARNNNGMMEAKIFRKTGRLTVTTSSL